MSRKLSTLDGQDEVGEPRLLALDPELVGEPQAVVVGVGDRPDKIQNNKRF